MEIAFLAPLKPPDHPEPSGDREMARLLWAALERGGSRVTMPSRLRLYDRSGAETPRLAAQAEAEARRWLARIRAGEIVRPDVVFTYHVYYKAPDVFGPLVAAALGIPYVVAEGSRAPKRAGGPWDAGHRLAEAALDAAALVLVLNERDREVLERARPAGQRLESVPPFVDAAAWPALERRGVGSGPLRLLAVAMMRDGDKLASYRLLAEALARRPELSFSLDVVGDGEARGAVEEAFRPLGDKVRFAGAVAERGSLARYYADADLLVWPAVNEAFGMVFLEAALQGCPALAGAAGGVPGVVRHGETGILTDPGSVEAFSEALAGLAGDPDRLARLGEGARRLARTERTLDQAAARLHGLLQACLAGRSAA